MLELRNVGRDFAGPEGEVKALTDVSISLAAGEMAAVRGPSGSGKSTLLLVAGGLLRPSSGTVLVRGQDPYALDPNARSAWRAANIGFVFQQFHLVPYLTVIENVLAPSVALPRKDAPERARSLVKRFGLEERANHVPAQLSTGERQRAALARALLNESGLILADEPTGNLDEANGRSVLGYLAEFARGGGAVLIVSHDRGIEEYASRFLEIRAGRLVS